MRRFQPRQKAARCGACGHSTQLCRHLQPCCKPCQKIALPNCPLPARTPTAPRPLAACLASLLPYGPLIAEHCIITASLDPARQLATAPLSPEEQEALLAGVRQWEAWLDGCEDDSTPPQGFILTRPQPGPAKQQQQQQTQQTEGGQQQEGGQAAGAAPAAVYDDFEPLLMAQHAHKPALSFPTFDAAVAEFFGKASWPCHLESQAPSGCTFILLRLRAAVKVVRP